MANAASENLDWIQEQTPTKRSTKTLNAQQDSHESESTTPTIAITNESEPTAPRPPRVIEEEDPADNFGHKSWESLNLAPHAEDPELTAIIELRRLADGAGALLEAAIAETAALEGGRTTSDFDLRIVPATMSVDDYLFRLLRTTFSSPETVVLALSYILRLQRDLRLDERNVHKLVLASLLVADKFNNDYAGSWSNKHFAECGCIQLGELHTLEAKLLHLLGWDAGISESEYSYCLESVMNWMEYVDPAPAQNDQEPVVHQQEAEAQEEAEFQVNVDQPSNLQNSMEAEESDSSYWAEEPRPSDWTEMTASSPDSSPDLSEPQCEVEDAESSSDYMEATTPQSCEDDGLAVSYEWEADTYEWDHRMVTAEPESSEDVWEAESEAESSDEWVAAYA